MDKYRFDERTRTSLRNSLNDRVPTMSDAQSAEIVDLACHAAERSMETIFETADRAGSPAAQFIVIQLGAMLALDLFNHSTACMRTIGAELGGASLDLAVQL